MDVLPSCPLTQPLYDCLRQRAEEPRRLQVPKRQPRGPNQPPGAWVTHHQPLLTILRDGHVPKPIPDVVLRKSRRLPDAWNHVPHRRQRKRCRWHHPVGAHRIVMTQPPLAPTLIHNGPRVDRRASSNLRHAMGRHVFHGPRRDGPIRLLNTFHQSLIVGPLIERDLRRTYLLGGIDAHPCARHDLIDLGRQSHIPPSALPRNLHVRTRCLRRLRLGRAVHPVSDVHAPLHQVVIHGLPSGQRLLSDGPECTPLCHLGRRPAFGVLRSSRIDPPNQPPSERPQPALRWSILAHLDHDTRSQHPLRQASQTSQPVAHCTRPHDQQRIRTRQGPKLPLTREPPKCSNRRQSRHRSAIPQHLIESACP